MFDKFSDFVPVCNPKTLTNSCDMPRLFEVFYGDYVCRQCFQWGKIDFSETLYYKISKMNTEQCVDLFCRLWNTSDKAEVKSKLQIDHPDGWNNYFSVDNLDAAFATGKLVEMTHYICWNYCRNCTKNFFFSYNNHENEIFEWYDVVYKNSDKEDEEIKSNWYTEMNNRRCECDDCECRYLHIYVYKNLLFDNYFDDGLLSSFRTAKSKM